jgi:hypothetical protein
MFFRDNQNNIQNDGEYMVRGYVLIETVNGVQRTTTCLTVCLSRSN